MALWNSSFLLTPAPAQQSTEINPQAIISPAKQPSAGTPARPSSTGKAAQHVANVRPQPFLLPNVAERDEATSEEEHGEGAFQPGFGRKHTRKHQKQKKRLL